MKRILIVCLVIFYFSFGESSLIYINEDSVDYRPIYFRHGIKYVEPFPYMHRGLPNSRLQHPYHRLHPYYYHDIQMPRLIGYSDYYKNCNQYWNQYHHSQKLDDNFKTSQEESIEPKNKPTDIENKMDNPKTTPIPNKNIQIEMTTENIGDQMSSTLKYMMTTPDNDFSVSERDDVELKTTTEEQKNFEFQISADLQK